MAGLGRARGRVRRVGRRAQRAVTIARGGVRELHEWELSDQQRAAMAAAGEAVRAAADAL